MLISFELTSYIRTDIFKLLKDAMRSCLATLRTNMLSVSYGYVTFRRVQFQPAKFQPLPFQPLTVPTYCIFKLLQFPLEVISVLTRLS